MSTRPDLDRSISEWLVAEAPDRAPERLLEASRAAIRTTRQRRAWWPAWRVPAMNNTVRLIAVVAVVAVVAVIGYQFLLGSGVGAPGASASPSLSPSDEPSATPVASAAAGPISFTELEAEGTELLPGEYLIDYATPVALVTFAVPDEPYGGWPSPWFKARYDWGPHHQSNAARFGVAEVDNLFADPCDPTLGPRDPVVGAGVDDFVTALVEVPGVVVSAPVDAELSGYTARYVEITGARPADCDEDHWMFETTRGDPGPLTPDTGDLVMVWVFDVEGQRLVMWAESDAEFEQSDHLEGLLDSLVIEAS
jgi:hypothetical protein